MLQETYDKKAEKVVTQGLKKSENEIYWDAVGGRSKKGRVKGLEKGAELYHSSQAGRSTSSQYIPSVVTQLQSKVHGMEQQMTTMRNEMEAEVQARVTAQLSEQMAALERMQKELWDEMLSRRTSSESCSRFPAQPRDPRNDPGSGGAGQGTPVA